MTYRDKAESWSSGQGPVNYIRPATAARVPIEADKKQYLSGRFF